MAAPNKTTQAGSDSGACASASGDSADSAGESFLGHLPGLGGSAAPILALASEASGALGEATVAKGFAALRRRGYKPGALERDVRTLDAAAALLRHPGAAHGTLKRLNVGLGQHPGPERAAEPCSFMETLCSTEEAIALYGGTDLTHTSQLDSNTMLSGNVLAVKREKATGGNVVKTLIEVSIVDTSGNYLAVKSEKTKESNESDNLIKEVEKKCAIDGQYKIKSSSSAKKRVEEIDQGGRKGTQGGREGAEGRDAKKEVGQDKSEGALVEASGNVLEVKSEKLTGSEELKNLFNDGQQYVDKKEVDDTLVDTSSYVLAVKSEKTMGTNELKKSTSVGQDKIEGTLVEISGDVLEVKSEKLAGSEERKNLSNKGHKYVEKQRVEESDDQRG